MPQIDDTNVPLPWPQEHNPRKARAANLPERIPEKDLIRAFSRRGFGHSESARHERYKAAMPFALERAAAHEAVGCSAIGGIARAFRSAGCLMNEKDAVP